MNTDAAGAHERWLAVRVRPGTHRDAVLAALFAVGAQGVQEVGDQLVTLLASGQSADDVTCAVLAASPDAFIETEETPRVDWSERWREAVHAQRLGPLVIAPPWLADPADESSLVSETSTEEIRRGIGEGRVSGGMRPKLEACADAVEQGVRAAHIVDGRVPHSLLLELFTDAGIGTKVRG